MALAFLCQEMVKADSPIMAPLLGIPDYPRTTASLDAFIVDHQMRKGSDIEARNVAAVLGNFAIRPHILRIDWSSHGDPSQLTNVETVARALRYQAMGRACKDKRINSLLLAHHADDQHESVLTRIYTGYLGVGLRGMSDIANVPECTGVYGVDQSGQPDYHGTKQDPRFRMRGNHPMLIESGGVAIGRPLLSLTKEDLVTVCKGYGVDWFEDSTNRDPTLTIRNTFRHSIRNEHLPLALSRRRILQLAAMVSEDKDEVESIATQHFNEMPSTLDLRSGTATFAVPRLLSSLFQTNYNVLPAILRKMLDTVSSKSTTSLQDLDEATDSVFSSEHMSDRPLRIVAAGVDIEVDTSVEPNSSSDRRFRFRRANPSSQDRKRILKLPLPQDLAIGRWSQWVLWDGRYWLRVRRPILHQNANVQVRVKFLYRDDIAALRKSVSNRAKHALNERLTAAKMSSRFTLPAIVIRKADVVETPISDQIVALPTLDWCMKGWSRELGYIAPKSWLYDIRYKHVTLDLGKKHQIVQHNPDVLGPNIKTPD